MPPDGETWIDKAKLWARSVKRDVVALWIAARDRRTPWLAQVLAWAIAAYALSPIDLIPDFIPVLGYLDDVILLPIAIMGVIRLIPSALMVQYRAEADRRSERPTSVLAAILIVALWLASAALMVWWFRVW